MLRESGWVNRTLLSIFISFLGLLVSVLLYNYLVMGKGYIWYGVGPAQWDYTIEWWEDAIPMALFVSPFLAVVISLLDECIRRLSFPKLLSLVIYPVGYAFAWIYLSLQVSKTYILHFGNTWTDCEIVDEIVFVVPVFTVLMIGISCSGTYWLLTINNKNIPA